MKNPLFTVNQSAIGVKQYMAGKRYGTFERMNANKTTARTPRESGIDKIFYIVLFGRPTFNADVPKFMPINAPIVYDGK